MCNRGSPEGAHPFRQEVWRMCLHKPLLFTAPFLRGRGPGGWSDPRSRPSPESRDSRGRRPLAEVPGIVPRACKRESPEGAHPFWQEVWRMCLHKPLLFTAPFLLGRGLGGWSEPLARRSPKLRESRGCRPLAEVPGIVPPACASGGVQRGRPLLAGGMEDVPP